MQLTFSVDAYEAESRARARAVLCVQLQFEIECMQQCSVAIS
jgi:hypothetical protein